MNTTEILKNIEILLEFDELGFKHCLYTYYINESSSSSYLTELINSNFTKDEKKIIKTFCTKENTYLTEDIVEKMLEIIETEINNLKILLFECVYKERAR